MESNLNGRQTTVDKEEDFLLLKMLPEQVSERWDKFAPLIAMSLPPVVYDQRLRMANVLRSILMEDLEVWVFYDQQNRERYVVSTLVRTDEVSLSKTLLIYSFTALERVVLDHFKQGLEVLKKYAKSRDCSAIITYVADIHIERLLVNRGASNDFKLIQIEV